VLHTTQVDCESDYIVL